MVAGVIVLSCDEKNDWCDRDERDPPLSQPSESARPPKSLRAPIEDGSDRSFSSTHRDEVPEHCTSGFDS